MKKRLPCLLFFLLLVLGSASAGVYTDVRGREVSIEKSSRTACLLSSYAELWGLSGGTVSVTVQESLDRGFALPSSFLVDRSSGMNINSELLLASRPDLVILSSTLSTHLKLEQMLEGAGIPCYYMALESFADFLSALKTFTTINKRPDLYETYGTSQEKQINALIEKAKTEENPPKILFLRAGAGFSATKARGSEDHFTAAIIKDLGATNIADGTPLRDSLSLEAVIENNPDKILIITQGDSAVSEAFVRNLFSTPGWKDLPAVKKGEFYFLDRELFHFKPNARWTEAYEVMYGYLYGETQ